MSLPREGPDFRLLRQAAEEQLTGWPTAPAVPAADAARLLHELQVHQVELEMQNDELRQARADAEAALARYTQLYDHAPVGYFTLDLVGAILQLNLAAARLLGDERSRLVGRAFREFLAPGDRQDFSAFLARLIARRSPAACELVLPGPGGETCHLRIEAAPDEADRTFKLIAVDVGTLKATERALLASEEQERRARAAAERANRAKTRFLAFTGHELRAPLTHIIVTANLLAGNLEGRLGADQANYALEIAELGSDLRHLVDDLLELASVEASTLTVHTKAVAIPDLLADIRRGYGNLARRKGLDFQIAIAAEVPAAIVTDPLRLQQILRALLGNAIKFTREGGIALRVRLAEASPGGIAPAIAFEVMDTGIGIATEDQESIFSFFSQEDGDPRPLFDQAGLGLPVVREIADLLGGELKVASGPGKGCTFTLYLPAEPGEEQKTEK